MIKAASRCALARQRVRALLAPPEQVVAVLAHELGHWHHSHLPKLLAAQQAASLAQLLLFTAVRRRLGVVTACACFRMPALAAGQWRLPVPPLLAPCRSSPTLCRTPLP